MLQPLADLLWSEDNLPSFQTERPLCSVDQLMIDATSAAMRIGSDSPYCLLNDPWTANLKGLSKRGVQSIKVLPEATTEFGIDRFTPETYNLHSAGASFDPCTFDLALRVVSRIIGPVAAELGDLGVGLLLYDIYTCDEASIASLFTAYSPSSATELERLVERDLRPLLTALKLADSSMAVTKAQELMERGVPVVPSRPARILRQGAVDVMPVASTRQWKRRHGLVAGDAKIEDIYDVSPPQADGLLVGQSLELSHPHWHTDVSPLAVSTQLVTIPSHIMNILDLKRQLIPRLETADVHSVLTGIIRPLDLFVKDPNVLASEYLDLLGEASVELVMFIVECAPSLSEQWSELKEATLRRMWSRSIKNRDRVFIGGRGEYQFRSFVKSVDVSDVVECVEWHTSEQAIQQSLKPGIAPPGPAGKLDTKFRLPPDAIVDTTEDTETITLPAPAPVVFDDEDRVPVSVLPDWAQLAFHGITSFNPVQSRVLDKAFGSHDNLLVMAPTGAGKTNIALLAILHQIGQNRTRSGKIRPAFSFKMIYIAPMKSLVGEMVRKFESCLKPLGITVCEMTGDQPLTRLQMMSVHLVVTVPEKWDIITRNSPDTALMECVKVVIVDEVHLLNDESRGPVLESVIVRHKYFVETGQSACRLVALSATLPNYQDVGLFLGAPASGLFAFDASWRPIPLEQKFTGVHVSGMNSFAFRERLNEEAFYATLEAVREGHQVIIFVHSRADTSATLRYILSHANEEQLQMFRLTTDPGPLIKRTRHHQLKDFIPYGMAMHNAGMLRSDRNLVESLFYKGDVRVLCSTATLAWGVNLPARQVIIKGTSVYDAARGGLVDIGIMDVLQVFGRAGRPQFDTLGSAHLITEHAKLESYVQAASANLPCESHLAARLQNLLNAEVSTGVVASIEEGMDWLAHSFYLIRAMHQPLKYNLTPDDVAIDADLSGFRRQLVHKAALELNQRKLVRFNPLSGVLSATELGRVATRFYLDVDTIGTFIRELPLVESPVDLLKVYCKASEFRDLKAREDERNELDHLAERCPLKLPQTKSQLTEKVYVGGRLKESKPQAKQGGDDSVANIRRKVGILIQANLSGLPIESHTLTSDMYHINQNAGRVSRAMFEMSLTPCFKMQHLTTLLLEWTKMMEQRLWFIGPCKVHPLMQFVDRWAVQHNDSSVHLRESTVARLEGYNMDRLLDFTPQELNAAAGRDWKKVKQCLDAFPWIEACYKIRPMTPTIIQVHMQVSARFNWSRRWHGTIQRFHLWVSNPAEASIIHHEVFSLTEEKYNSDDPMELIFTLPVHEPRPAQYSLQVVSDSWSGSSYDDAIALGSFIPPSSSSSQTALLPLDPLPVAVLQDPRFRTLYTGFKFLNPIQTQVFHACFHTDANILLGAPTGSGKTMVGEFTVMRLFKREPKAKVVYIAPLKALSRERFDDWKAKFDPLGFPVVQMTGDVTPDFLAIRRASIIITTPEKWDGVSRMWRQRSYVKDVRLVVVDEIHLLGYDRGPVIEAVVSRMRFIAHKVGKGMRFVGLSTALDNSEDIAMWLGVCQNGHFNFRPAVRPVPCRVTIQGFHEKHYCPRMGTMNKPAFSIICNDSPNHPVLIFVSSRRQTRLTALDLIACCAKDNCPFRFKHESRLPSGEFQSALENFKDSTVQHCVSFGVGLHHAGLCDNDRQIVERLFREGAVQILVCTSTLAWGVNFPARLVIIKGTEYFDGMLGKYVEMPLTDILQMIGRAGRPQFDDRAYASLLVHEPQRSFYRRFLYEPFPVESFFHKHLVAHVNAEISTGAVRSPEGVLEYLSWTYLFRRLMANPDFYIDEDPAPDASIKTRVKAFLNQLVTSSVDKLLEHRCIERVAPLDDDEEWGLEGTTLGRIACLYYLAPATAAHFDTRLRQGDMNFKEVLVLLSTASEFEPFPVRHNEDKHNEDLGLETPFGLSDLDCTDDPASPFFKVFLLLQCHIYNIALPVTDYVTDLKSCLDQCGRLLQALLDIAYSRGSLDGVKSALLAAQCLAQGSEPHTHNGLRNLPHSSDELLSRLRCGKMPITKLGELVDQWRIDGEGIAALLGSVMKRQEVSQLTAVLDMMPRVTAAISVTPKPIKGHVKTDDGVLQIVVDVKWAHKPSKMKVYSKKVKKEREPGWVALVYRKSELLLVQRIRRLDKVISIRTSTVCRGEANIEIGCCLVSDSYLGIDFECSKKLTLLGWGKSA